MSTPPSPDTPLYTIGTAARMLGVSIHTLRLYERRGLVIPHHAASSQRRYSGRDIERIQCIRDTINVDKISIEGIRRILSLVPCWAIMRCPEPQRESCSAYTGQADPCWQSKCKGGHCLPLDCRTCTVYVNYGECHAIKMKLRELLPATLSTLETVT
jgi:MerR family transcriptional regulator, heat shock protein HspR